MQAFDLHEKLNELGIPFNEIGYMTKAPKYPYGIYVDDVNVRLDDYGYAKVENHTVTIELYHETLDGLREACAKLDTWIEGMAMEYRRRNAYIPEENHFFATYMFAYTTKKKG